MNDFVSIRRNPVREELLAQSLWRDAAVASEDVNQRVILMHLINFLNVDTAAVIL